MADYSTFVHGAVQYPLTDGGPGESLLFSADPSLFYLLEFYESVLTTHLQARFMSEVTAVGCDSIAKMVAETLPLNPEDWLTEEHIKFPLLTACRKKTKFQYIGQRKVSIDNYEVAYVLPPLSPGEAARLLPILRSVASVLNQRTEQGADPAYTPTEGTLGESVWLRAGVARAEVLEVDYGGYGATDAHFFPAVMLKLELREVSNYALSTLSTFGGVSEATATQAPEDTPSDTPALTTGFTSS